MYESKWLLYKNNYYYFSNDGTMGVNGYVKSKDPSSKLYYWLDSDGIYRSKWDTENPDLNKYLLIE